MLPAVKVLRDTLDAKASEFTDIVMVGRTHLQDATPVMLGQVILRLGRAARSRDRARSCSGRCPGSASSRSGGPRSGPGLNAHPRFGDVVAEKLRGADRQVVHVGREQVRRSQRSRRDGRRERGYPDARDRSLQDRERRPLLRVGPRAGIAEIKIPENEPGSSIMPGKINPTQSEAMTMVCAQVFGQRRGGCIRRLAGPVPAERLQAGDAPQRPGVGELARRCVPRVQRSLRGRASSRTRR